MSLYIYSHTECTTPRVNNNVNYGLQVTMMCQYRVINFNKFTSLVEDATMKEAMHMGGQRVYKKSLYCLLNLAEPKSAINKVLLCVHFKIYTNIKSLYYTPETNPLLLLIHITNITLHQLYQFLKYLL